MTLADRRLHMIGIGGAGMSALAVVAYAWGADVSGCDRTSSEYSLRLRRFGIDVSEGHDRVSRLSLPWIPPEGAVDRCEQHKTKGGSQVGRGSRRMDQQPA